MSSSPPLVAAVAVAFAAVAGSAAGLVTAYWLARLPRGARIPPRWCVLGVGVSWAAVAAGWTWGVLPGAVVPLLAGLSWLTVAGSAVDLVVHRLPDALTLPAAPVTVALLVPLGGAAVVRGVLAAALLCTAYGLVRLVRTAAMGGGDVKLAAAVGAALGGSSWDAVLLGTVLAAVLTAAVALCSAVVSSHSSATEPVGRWHRRCLVRPRSPADRRAGRSDTTGRGSGPPGGPPGGPVPHGPSMLLSCLAVVATAAVA